MENQAFTHFQSLIEALGAAMTRCVVWRYADNNEKYNALQLYRFAEEFDRENPSPNRHRRATPSSVPTAAHRAKHSL